MIRLSIRRPVAVTMTYTCVTVLGAWAWRNIPLEFLPEVTFPRFTLSAGWSGTSPEMVEAFVTSPIEAAIQQMKEVERITSTTMEGSAEIVVEFARDADMDFVKLDLSERIAAMQEGLPDGVGHIELTPYVPRALQGDANRPLLSYMFTGPLVTEALRLHLDEVIAPELLQIRGVSGLEVTGGRDRLIEIELHPDRIASLGLTPSQVRQSIASLQMVRDAGGIREGDRELTVTIRNRPSSLKEVRDAILPIPGITPVRLDEIAELSDGFEEQTSYYRINRRPALNVQIHKERGANAVRLAEVMVARIGELEAMNPPGSRFILTYNQANDIRRQLMDLRTRAIIAAGVIFLVLLAFLRVFRAALVIFSTIAFSILIAVNLVYFGGLTLNIMTLMGLALGFGLIVDNSIVVLENIYRNWQQGREPAQASEHGAREVVLPILATTATTLIVLLPFVYLQGELRVIYLPLAIVVALALVASMVVAFTFIPALTTRVLRRSSRRDVVDGDPVLRLPTHIRFYSDLLGYTLRFPWLTILVTLLCIGATGLLFDKHVRRGRVFGGGAGSTRSWIDVRIGMPRGSDLERMDELVRYFEDRLAMMPEVERFESTVERERGTIRVEFPEKLQLTSVPLAVEDQLRSFGLGFTGADVHVYGQGPAFYGSLAGSAPNVQITLHGYNYQRLAEITDDLGRRLSLHSRVQGVNTNATGYPRDRQTEFVAFIDRRAADRHRITVSEVSDLVRSLVRGTATVGGTITVGGEPLRYEVKLAGYRLADVDALRETVVTTTRGARVPLGELIDLQEREVPSAIVRENQQYERTVAYEFRGPRRLSETLRDATIAATVLPPGYSIHDTSPVNITQGETRQIRLVLAFSLALIFMVTASLFESLRQPLVVLLAVPMALVGVFLIFFFVRATFTREAYVALIMMGGIVVNNAILLVDRINRLRQTEIELCDAIIAGTLERVRPILMTTTTTVFGLLPLVLFMPMADARIWNAFTYAVIGGLLSSTAFVLTTTPAIYFLLERGVTNTRAAG